MNTENTVGHWHRLDKEEPAVGTRILVWCVNTDGPVLVDVTVHDYGSGPVLAFHEDGVGICGAHHPAQGFTHWTRVERPSDIPEAASWLVTERE